MAIDKAFVDSDAGRDVGGLALSCVQVDNAMATVRAAGWRNTFTRLGVSMPWFVIHDIGMLLTTDLRACVLGPRPFVGSLPTPRPITDELNAWTATLSEIATSEVMEKARSWRMSDDLVSIVLLHVLQPLNRRFENEGRTRVGAMLPLDPGAYSSLNENLPTLFRQHRRESDIAFLSHVASQRLRLVTSVEQIDLDTLRLVGLFGAEAGAMSALSMLDLLNVLGSPEANDVANFSLDLMPSILETRRATGEQTLAIDGYAGFARHGQLDSLVLSELAYDEDLFDRRFVENEVFYYAREKAPEQVRTLHYICVDASASMRGQRATFARGLALTLMKKFSLQSEEVAQRFFDSRLYEPTRVHATSRKGDPNFHVAHVLSFVGEHGRHYAKVFTALTDELKRLKNREDINIVLYILTHAECHIPREVVELLRKEARLYGVFMLPSAGILDLEYLDLFHTTQVVDEAALVDKTARAERALSIVDDAAKKKIGSASPS